MVKNNSAVAVVYKCYVEVPDHDDNVCYDHDIIMARVKLDGKEPKIHLLEVVAPVKFKRAWPFVKKYLFIECDGPSRTLTRDEHLKMFSSPKQ